MKKITLLFAFCLIALSLGAQPNDMNCFSIIAGKNATADGSVLFAHNEDDSGEQMLNIYVTEHEATAAKYIWTEFPGMKQADSFLNEYGVAVASDYSPSREDMPEFTDGGVLYELRVTVAQKAHTAREAVLLMGELVEKYGYTTTGRSYMVADCNEGWIFSVVVGKHWVAARVPDDKVMIIPNNYVIDKVDLSDPANYLGSKDLITYAQKRGWYDPEKDGEFSFKKVYSNPAYLTRFANVSRHLSAIQMITGKDYPADANFFEFAVTPKKKLKVEDLIEVMRSHGENTIYADTLKTSRNGHHPGCICALNTVVSTVYQLRSNMPKEIASLAWIAPGRACANVYAPWYIGMSKSPKGYTRFESYKEAQEKHLSDGKELRKNYPDGFYWKVVDKFNVIDADYHNNITPVAKQNAKIQKKLFKNQKRFEKKVIRAIKKGQDVSTILNEYTTKFCEK